MRHRLPSALAAVAGLTCLVAPAIRAQGALSTLGFGYPSGQLSSRALAAGGALADFDPNSPLNPATLVSATRAVVYIQYDPEFRSLTVDGRNASTTTARFPLFSVTGRVAGFGVGLAFSSFLDRTWMNVRADTQTIGGERLASVDTARSSGGISDARAAISYSISKDYHIGIGVHVFPGENRTRIGRFFADSLNIGSFSQENTFNFSGSAVSLGLLATPSQQWNLALTGRFGGAMRVRMGDSTVIGSARVPARWSASVAYLGIPGSSLAAHYVSEHWSSLRGLGSQGLPIHDATEFGAGAEVAGPKMSGVPLQMRLGVRQRDLPFSLDATAVREQSLTGGIGLPISGGRGTADLSVSRARRTAEGVSETGWIVSFGLGIRP
jgi:hypothetical protein